MQSATDKPSRIIDIALQAGVSTATVDRVLNDRPGVRDSTRKKVEDAVRLLDSAQSRPKIIPSYANAIEIDVIIAGNAGFANDMLARELKDFARKIGVTINAAYPKRLDPEALARALNTSLERGSSGIIVQALDHPLVRSAVDHAADCGVPVVSMLTGLPGSKTRGYVGLDNRAAGRTAGLLTGLLTKNSGDVAIFLGGPLYRSHEEREMGIRTKLREDFPHLNIRHVFQSFDDPEKNMTIASALLAQEKDLVAIINIGGGNRGIERALLDAGRKNDITYVCFNLTPLTRQALLSGVVDAVVHQDMARAARVAIRSIADHLTSRQPEFQQIPVEVILRENIR